MFVPCCCVTSAWSMPSAAARLRNPVSKGLGRVRQFRFGVKDWAREETISSGSTYRGSHNVDDDDDDLSVVSA